MTRPSLSLSPLRVALQIAAAFLLLFAVAEPSLAAAAQTRPQPVPVALSEVKLINENAEESRFELAFDPTTTSFATIASQPVIPFGSVERNGVKFVSPNQIITRWRSGEAVAEAREKKNKS